MTHDHHSYMSSGQESEMPRVTIITVVRNDVDHIEQTLDSALSQRGVKVQYIVFDGASDDGTNEKIRQYLDGLHLKAKKTSEESNIEILTLENGVEILFRSAADEGMYDALNQALPLAKGDWISVLNSGDTYCSTLALVKLIEAADDKADVVFGHSIEAHPEWDEEKRASNDIDQLRIAPTFRHGSAIIRREVHQHHPFDLTQKQQLGYALDWEMLHRLWIEGYKFVYSDSYVERYRTEGMSNHPYRNLIYNYRIITKHVGETTERKPCSSAKAMIWVAKNALYIAAKNSILYKYARSFTIQYMINDILPHIPSWRLRKMLLKCTGMKIGEGSMVSKRNYLINANRIEIGKHSHINTQCILDARGGIAIGSNVSISHRVNIMTGSHDIQSKDFRGIFKPIVIDDYAWIGIGATLLQGIRIGEGAVVCAGAVVTHDVAPHTIVAGIPAKVIGTRNEELNYECKWNEPFT